MTDISKAENTTEIFSNYIQVDNMQQNGSLKYVHQKEAPATYFSSPSLHFLSALFLIMKMQLNRSNFIFQFKP